MGVHKKKLFFLKESYSLAYQQIFGTLKLSPVEAFLWTSLQNRNKCIPEQLSFSVYTYESWTLGKSYGQWGATGNILRNNLKTWGTFRERDETC